MLPWQHCVAALLHLSVDRAKSWYLTALLLTRHFNIQSSEKILNVHKSNCLVKINISGRTILQIAAKVSIGRYLITINFKVDENVVCVDSYQYCWKLMVKLDYGRFVFDTISQNDRQHKKSSVTPAANYRCCHQTSPSTSFELFFRGSANNLLVYYNHHLVWSVLLSLICMAAQHKRKSSCVYRLVFMSTSCHGKILL